MHSPRIHILGGSGSGTSTFGRALGERLGCQSYDTDTFYWMPTDPPFRVKRDISDRIALLTHKLSLDVRWVLSGSLAGWGDVFIPHFTDVILLTLPPEVRMARLRARERDRYGADRIAFGGELHEEHEAFMQWAALYDMPGHAHRSRAQHEAWLEKLPQHVTVHQLDSSTPPRELVELFFSKVSILGG